MVKSYNIYEEKTVFKNIVGSLSSISANFNQFQNAINKLFPFQKCIPDM